MALQLEVPYAPTECAISVEEVEHHLHNLDTSKAHGPESMRRDCSKMGLVMKKRKQKSTTGIGVSLTPDYF